MLSKLINAYSTSDAERKSQQIGALEESLEDAKRRLAELQNSENADVYAALHKHLTRLGWRSETEEDRQRAHQRRISQLPIVLQELKELEKRPQGTTGEWTKALDRYPPIAPDAQALEGAKLLRALAFSGRISKEEYDSYFKRLELRGF